MNNCYDDLKKLIDYIQCAYHKTNELWKTINVTPIHLKKKLVSDIEINPVGTIYTTIQQYVQFLNERSTSILFDLALFYGGNVNARVKAPNSIEYKIQNYKSEKHAFGKVPINKCLNDLFGFRIFFDKPVSLSDIENFIDNTYSQGTHYIDKCIDSSKLEYKAVHVYFREDNFTFPWELQIWCASDVENNFASHKKYKQEYTYWEKQNKEMKEGGIMND